MNGRYSHAYELAFEVKTDHDAESVTREELIDALRARLRSFEQGEDDIVEAAGLPFDTDTLA